MRQEKENAYWEINTKSGWLWFPAESIWQYRDLLLRLVRRDFLISYQQTIIGPLWIFIQPLFVTLTYIIIFSSVLRIPTNNTPSILFYLTGIILWNYFSESLSAISNSFHAFAFIFNKVYFPRLVVPISYLLSAFIRFGIQFLLLCFIYIYYLSRNEVSFTWNILYVPFLLIILSVLSFGLGLIFASLTAKYRDLQNLLGIVLRIWMLLTPIIYPLSIVPDKYRNFLLLNPVSSIIEFFRFAFLGYGYHEPEGILYSILFTVVVLLAGIYLFNRREGLVMDTI